MKKQVSLIGFALLSFSNILSAGCITLAAAKTNPQNQQADQMPPKILYPQGQNDRDPTFVLGAYYLGGYVGPNSLQTATGGVLSVRTAAGPAQGAPQFAPLSWNNGFIVELAGTSAGKGGHSLSLLYGYLTGNNSVNTMTAPVGINSIAPALAIDNIGTFTPQNSSSVQYKLPYYMFGLATYSRALITVDNVFSLKAVTGAQVVAVNHTLNLSYTDTSANLTTYTLQETTAGVGPLVGFNITFLLYQSKPEVAGDMTQSIGFRGFFVGSAPLSSNTLTQSDIRVNSIGAATYGLNTTGNQTRQSFAGIVDLDFVWSMEFDMMRMEFVAGWATQQNVGLTRLGQATTLQGTGNINIAMNVLKAGLSFIF